MDYQNTQEIIRQGNLISDEDFAFIESSIDLLTANWHKNQRFRTETEMRISVLNEVKFPTPAAKYWQCVREQSVFYEQLVSASFEYRRNAIKLAKKQAKLDKCEEGFKKELLKIDIEEMQYAQMTIEASAKDRMRELRLWDQLMREQVAADPEFDTENVNTHQHVSYLMRWHHQLKGLDRSKSSVSEVNNLIGQYASGLKLAFERGVVLPQALLTDAKALGVASPEPTVTKITYDLRGVS